MKLRKLSIPLAAAIQLGEPIKGVGSFQSGGDTKTLLGQFISTIITTLTVIASLAFVIYFIMGAFKWITSSGDKSSVEEGKTQLTQGALGLIVVVVAYFIAGIIGGVLGIDILNPGTVLGL